MNPAALIATAAAVLALPTVAVAAPTGAPQVIGPFTVSLTASDRCPDQGRPLIRRAGRLAQLDENDAVSRTAARALRRVRRRAARAAERRGCRLGVEHAKRLAYRSAVGGGMRCQVRVEARFACR